MLRDLAGVGRSIAENLNAFGVQSVAELARRDGDELYTALCRVTGVRQDPCVLDTFRCAVAQAANPRLPADNETGGGGPVQRKRARSVPCRPISEFPCLARF